MSNCSARARVVLLVPVILLAAGVRLLGLGNTDLWGDEAFSVMASLGPVSHLLSMLSTGEPHPPLYPFLLVVWLRGLGHSELVARLPSAFAGIASVPVAAAIARRFAGDKDERGAAFASVVAGLLVALNPIQIWYSQEARMYAQVSFFAGLATLALLRLRSNRRASGTLYALATLGAAGSHYYGLFVPLAHGLAIARFAPRQRELAVRWLRAVGVAALLYLPWVVIALHIFTSYYGARPGTVDLPGVALSGWVRIAAGWSLSWPHAVEIATLVTVFVLAGLAMAPVSEDDRFARVAVGCWLFTPFVVGFLLSLVRPVYAERYFVVSSLAMSLLAARLIVSLAGRTAHSAGIVGGHLLAGVSGLAPSPKTGAGSRSRLRGLLAAAVTTLAVGLALPALVNVWHGRYLKSAYDTHMQMVNALARPNDAVILDGTSQLPLYEYYLTKPYPTYPLPERLPLDEAATAASLARISQEHEGAWIFLYATPDYDPGYFVPRWLTANAFRAFDVWEVNGRLQYYRFARSESMTVRQGGVTFGSSLLLQRYSWLDTAYAAGDTIPVDLTWRWLPTTLAQPRVALRLVDAAGLTWVQSDQSIGGGFLPAGSWPEGQSLDDHHGLMILPGTPPGTYRLLLNVYSSDHPDPLPPSGSGLEIAPSGVVLATIRVDTASQNAWLDGIAGFHPSTATFGGLLALLGYAGSDEVTAGESGYLTLVWKALVPRPPVSQLQFELIAADGSVAERRDLPLATADFPPARWERGDVLREQYRLPIAARLRPGRYRLAIEPLTATGQASTIGSLVVRPGREPAVVAAPAHPMEFTLGDVIALDGYDLEATHARPGSTINLALHWRDLGSMDIDYTVFVHVLDASEKVVTQRDQQPADGRRPTSSWFPGDEILDRYTLTLPSALASGEYPIEVGMYNPGDGRRLPVSSGGVSLGDRIIVARLHVDG